MSLTLKERLDQIREQAAELAKRNAEGNIRYVMEGGFMACCEGERYHQQILEQIAAQTSPSEEDPSVTLEIKDEMDPFCMVMFTQSV